MKRIMAGCLGVLLVSCGLGSKREPVEEARPEAVPERTIEVAATVVPVVPPSASSESASAREVIPGSATSATIAPSAASAVAPDPTDEDPGLVIAHIDPPGSKGCVPGQRRTCYPEKNPGCPHAVEHPTQLYCVPGPSGHGVWSSPGSNTPLVLVFDDAPVRFTRPESQNAFPIGEALHTEWVSSTTPWLVLDADRSGCIEDQTELFGPDGTASNGFEKLARLDANGDGRIDASDPAFARLALWSDADQDRTCAPRELVSLAAAGVESIDLTFSPREPKEGSHEGERSTFQFHGTEGATRTGHIVDVYLMPLVQ